MKKKKKFRALAPILGPKNPSTIKSIWCGLWEDGLGQSRKYFFGEGRCLSRRFAYKMEKGHRTIEQKKENDKVTNFEPEGGMVKPPPPQEKSFYCLDKTA